MKLSVMILSLLVSASGLSADVAGVNSAPAANPPVPAVENFPLSSFAAVGSRFIQASRLNELDWTEEQIAAFLDGIRTALHGKGYDLDETAQRMTVAMGERLHELEIRKQKQVAERLAQPGQLAKYLKEMRKRFNLQLSDSGLAYSIQAGQMGVRPRPGDTVVVSCEARAADGTTKLPQLSNDHVRVKLAALLPGFMEALQMMTVDSTAMLLVPPELSFGANEWPEGVERGMPLLFKVTLHEVISVEAAP